MSIDSIRNEIIKFKNDIVSQKLDSYYGDKSYSEILGVSRRELSHSSFITWLLDNKESHNLIDYPIKKFLEILVISSNEKQKKQYKELFDAIIIDDLKINTLKIETEYRMTKTEQLDIYIETNITYLNKTNNIRIIIENKVSAKEHNEQTTRYYKYYSELEDGWTNLYVYLTPLSGISLSELTEVECSCKAYIQTNYQNLVDYLLEPILNKNISAKTRNIIKEYLQTLSQPTQNNETEKHEQGLIMAIGNEEKELLTKFWDKNQKLILSALYALSLDSEQEKDLRDNIESTLDSISNNKKDKSLLTIYYDKKEAISKIKKSDLGYETVKLLDDKNLIDKDLFSFLQKDKSCGFILLKLEEEMSETEKKYSKYRFKKNPELIYEEKEYYVARNWDKENIQKFIATMTKKINKLEYKIYDT